MPAVEAETPRKMFPPPITTATCTPAFTTSPISVAVGTSVGGWMPYFPSPMRASPESLRRMRRYRRGGVAVTFDRFYPARGGGSNEALPTRRARNVRSRTGLRLGARGTRPATGLPDGLGHLGGQVFLLLLHALAHLVPSEPADGDVLADLGDGLGDHLVDLLLVVLHEGLVHETHRLEVLLDLPGEDLLDHRLGLLLLPELDPLDLLLPLEQLNGDLLAADELGAERGDVEGEIADQGLEILVPGHEVGLAVHLDQDANLAVVDVGAHEALRGGAPGLLGLAGDARLPEPLLGLREVAAGLGERFLAVHHPGSGLFPELLHHRGGHVSHLSLSSCGPAWPRTPWRVRASAGRNRSRSDVPGTPPRAREGTTRRPWPRRPPGPARPREPHPRPRPARQRPAGP